MSTPEPSSGAEQTLVLEHEPDYGVITEPLDVESTEPHIIRGRE